MKNLAKHLIFRGALISFLLANLICELSIGADEQGTATSSLYFETTYDFGFSIPSGWTKLDNISAYNPESYPVWASSSSFSENWGNYVVRYGGILDTWVKKLPDSSVAVLLVSAGEVKHALEEGETLVLINLDDIRFSCQDYASYIKAATILQQPVLLGDKEAWRFDYQGLGYGIALTLPSETQHPTSQIVTKCPMIRDNKDYVFSLEIRCPTEHYGSVLADYDSILKSFYWGAPKLNQLIPAGETSDGDSLSQADTEKPNNAANSPNTLYIPDIGIGSPFDGSEVLFINNDGSVLKYSVSDAKSLKIAVDRMLDENDMIFEFIIRVWLPLSAEESVIPDEWKNLDVEFFDLYKVIPLKSSNPVSKNQFVELIDSLNLPPDSFIDFVELHIAK